MLPGAHSTVASRLQVLHKGHQLLHEGAPSQVVVESSNHVIPRTSLGNLTTPVRERALQVRELLDCSPVFTEPCRGFSGNCGEPAN
jgi:hypothetical protein